MSTDLSKSTSRITLKKFKEIKARVDKYLSDGGKVTSTTRVCPDHPDPSTYILYSQYQNMLARYNAFIKKNSREPKTLQIYVEATDLTNTGAKIPLATFLDMKARVDSFIADGGKPEYNRRIYLDFTTQMDYVTYSTYLAMLKKYSDFVAKNSRQPNYITTTKSGSSTPTITTKDCYKSPRWYSGTELKQDTNYYCGCNLSQQILREITGNYYSESYLAKQLGTTKSGTGPNEITSVIKKILTQNGYTVKTCKWVYLSDYTWDSIGKMIADPKTGVGLHSVYKLRWGHYEYPIKLCKSSETITIAQGLSGGYIQLRSFKTMKSYANAASYPSLLIVEVA
ncbi:pseudomurein-binding repeat-containing protein [Methanobrevibacter sp. UBA417]|jgi:hypothetical protein|uniref:pseudomurein-binding repeat-containing protein n=1 Tax=Methanobrevibacter sp. UBA417 TaxID=1915487 RepID=UPI0039B936C6